MMRSYFISCIFLLPFLVKGQDLQRVVKLDSLGVIIENPIRLMGNIGVSFRSYQAWNIENQQYPLTSTIIANTTIEAYGVTIPFTFVMHNLDENDHPFQKGYWKGFLTNQRNRLTRFGASPYYKRLTVHLGHRYMNLSEFTLSNHHFLGAGVEFKPEKWRVAGMAGRLTKAEPQSISLRTPNIQKYTRTGWGFKLGYGSPKDFIEATIFSAKDDPRSLDFQNDSLFLVTPQENLALSLKGKVTISDHLSFQFELAESALTRNANDPVYQRGFALYQSFLFTRKTSSAFHTAADAKLEYARHDLRTGLAYRRIEPGYRSLGAYFFNDDLENITAFSNFSAFKKSVNFQLQGGIQRNNLDGVKVASFRRVIGSANVAYRLKEWILNANVSNFSSRVEYQLNPALDSLNAVIVSRETNFSVTKVFPGRGESFRTLNCIAGFQTVNDQIENAELSVASDLFFANASYSFSTASEWLISFNADFNSNSLNQIKLNRYGTGFQVGKGFDDQKFQAGLGSNYYLQTSNDDLEIHLWSHFVRGSWQVFRAHSLNLQLNWIRNNRTGTVGNNRYSELMGTIGYNVQFGNQFSKHN